MTTHKKCLIHCLTCKLRGASLSSFLFRGETTMPKRPSTPSWQNRDPESVGMAWGTACTILRTSQSISGPGALRKMDCTHSSEKHTFTYLKKKKKVLVFKQTPSLKLLFCHSLPHLQSGTPPFQLHTPKPWIVLDTSHAHMQTIGSISKTYPKGWQFVNQANCRHPGPSHIISK